MSTCAVHLRQHAFDVQITRPSKWGNPFRIGPDGTRAEVLEKYAAWIRTQPELVRAAKLELRGKRLGCVCVPKACHGHILAAIAEQPFKVFLVGAWTREDVRDLPAGTILVIGAAPDEKAALDAVWADGFVVREYTALADAFRAEHPDKDGLGFDLVIAAEGADPAIVARAERAGLEVKKNGARAAPPGPVRASPASKENLRLPVALGERKSAYDPRAHGALCDDCPCRGVPVVPPTLPADGPDAVLVGMEPGYTEERERRPFCGPSGKKIDQLLERHGLDRKRMHVTNAALCRPRKDEHRPAAFKCCLPRLQRELDQYPASVPIMPMGAPAFQSVFGKKVPITSARGFVWRKNRRDILPTIHPAFVLRDSLQFPLLSRDIRRLALRIKQGFIELDNPGIYYTPRTPKALAEVLAKFMGEEVALDIETSEDPPTEATLSCIGLSDGTTTAVVPWNEFFRDQLATFVRSKVIITHNGPAFDHIVLARYGIEVDRWEDTLVAHHVYASHFRQALEHCVSFYLDAPPWKRILGKAATGDEKGRPKKFGEDETLLFKYNALDAYLTFKLWRAMQADLEKWRDLYANDKEIAAMARHATETGAYVDIERKEMLSAAIKEKEVRLHKEMIAIVGHDFTPTKTNEIRTILFEEFGAPVLERTATGLQSTNKATLQAFASMKDRPYGEFCKRLVEWRVCTKIRATYLDNLPVSKDRRVHAGWRSCGPPTGRWACRRPNLQNLKRPDKRFKGEPEYRVREIYTAPAGHQLVGFDMCFARGTLVDTPTGDVPIERLAVGSLVYTYRAETRRPAIGRVTQHLRVGVYPVLKIVLDNGATIRCTREHKFMVCPSSRSKDRAPVDRVAGELRTGDRLFPLRKLITQGYEVLYAHKAIEWAKTHCEVALAVFGPPPKGYHVHHKDGDPRNNHPSNLEYKSAWAHQSDHGRATAKKCWSNSVTAAAMREGIKRALRERGGHHGKNNPRYGDRRGREHVICNQCRKKFTDFKSRASKYCSYSCWIASRQPPLIKCLYCEQVVKPRRTTTKYCSRTCRDRGHSLGLNHKVVSVEPDGVAEVWSIGVDPDRNYALSAGVFVRNSQVEMRVAAHLSGDPNFIASCESQDMHASNARLLFGDLPELLDVKEAKEGRGKPLRDIAKSSGFAVNYLAGPETVFENLRAQGFNVKFKDVVRMLERLRKAFERYYRFVEENIDFCRKNGFVMTGFLSGRVRYLGHSPSPSDVANTPIQGGAADVMNALLLRVWKRRPPGARLVAQIHDDGKFECPDDKVEELERIMDEEAAKPVRVRDHDVVFPIDRKKGHRWSEM